MSSDLARLKPEPLPSIDPVPEHAAGPELAAVYARTREGLGVPWMGVVAMAFARYPQFYETLWCALEPLAGTRALRMACEGLRSCAEAEADRLAPATVLPRLEALGYGEGEVEEIRACNEVFSSGNMPYLLMASLARLLLEGHAWKGEGDLVPEARPASQVQRPVLIEPHHADPTVAGLYADIRQTLGLPFVNTDYRAFARWPSYFCPAWQDLRAAVTGLRYEACVERVHGEAVRLALTLPNPTDLDAKLLRDAASRDAGVQEVLNVVRLFQWLLPGLVTNVAYFRAQLIS